MKEKLLTLHGMRSYELPNQRGIFNYCIYAGNILDVFTLSHFVFNCHIPLHIYLLMYGWEVLFCFMSLI